MEQRDYEKQQKEYVAWCEKQKLEPKEYKNLKKYLREEKIWGSIQTRSEA